jgi:hypothetical protein
MSVKKLRFYFIGDQPDSATKRERGIIEGEIVITDVKDMVRRILQDVTRTGGRIKSILISSHGSEKGFRIGQVWVSVDTLPGHAYDLALLTPFFDKDTRVFISSCLTGLGTPLLRAFSKALGGVKVIAWKGEIGVVGYFLGDYMEYPTERVVCTMNTCKSESENPFTNWKDVPVDY